MQNSKTAERNSSVELFRILATFLVLIVHCNGWFVGMPTSFVWKSVSAFTVGQTLIESFSCVCVNCFLVISGYYGIKFKYRSVWNMFVLLLSIYVPFCIVQMLYAGDFNVKQLLLSFFAFSRESYFVQCYLMLTFLSPVLNSFIEKYNRHILKYVFVFWGIEIYFECLRGNESLGFNDGYSVIHFILIYMLGRCLFLYRDKVLKINRNCYLGGASVNDCCHHGVLPGWDKKGLVFFLF